MVLGFSVIRYDFNEYSLVLRKLLNFNINICPTLHSRISGQSIRAELNLIYTYNQKSSGNNKK